MKIKDREKFIARITELIIFLATILITPMVINYANELRGHQAYGGEYLVPVLGLIVILIIEAIYEDNENKKKGRK